MVDARLRAQQRYGPTSGLAARVHTESAMQKRRLWRASLQPRRVARDSEKSASRTMRWIPVVPARSVTTGRRSPTGVTDRRREVQKRAWTHANLFRRLSAPDATRVFPHHESPIRAVRPGAAD